MGLEARENANRRDGRGLLNPAENPKLSPMVPEKGDSVSGYLVLPGYGDSGPGHWQTLWEEAGGPAFNRVRQRDWISPDRKDWVETLDRAVLLASPGTVLIAHSLACLLVAHWSAQAPSGSLAKIRAAFLVAPVDPLGPVFPATATGFSPVPLRPFPFPALVAASSDDPYATLEFSRACAEAWGCGLAGIGAKGHINSDSGIGAWPEGRALLSSLIRE
ncbi:MAG: hypothetical protein JWP91_3874 [Fibrobacteres bacterium]|nr:hypothetical protein [Fibrobacterota bacterium]